MMIPAWLRIWKFLDGKNKAESVSEIMRSLSMSPVSAYDGVIFLDELGLVNILQSSTTKEITPTQKFYSTKSVFQDVYDVYAKDSDKGSV